jgi:type II secretory pathway component PulF
MSKTSRKEKGATAKIRGSDWRLFPVQYELGEGRIMTVRVLAPNEKTALLGVPTLADEKATIKPLGDFDEAFQRAFESKTPKDAEVSGFISYLNRSVGKNYPMQQALKISLVSVKSPVLRGIVAVMRQMLGSGHGTIADAMAFFPDVFEVHYVNMIRASQETGALPKMMDAIARAMLGKNKLKKIFIAKMSYPFGTFLLGIVVCCVILFGALPKAVEPALSSGREIWAISRVPYEAIVFLQERPVLFLLPIIVGFIFFIQWKVITRSEFFQRRIAKIPRLGDTLIAFGIVNPLRVLSMMQRAGIAAGMRITTACEASGNLLVRDFFVAVGKRVIAGIPIETAFAYERYRIGEVGDDLTAQATISSETGAGEDLLDEIADRIEADTETRIHRLAAFLGPLTICFVLALAGFSFAAVYAVQVHDLYEYLKN